MDKRKILYFDCFSGVSNDRLLGGLLGVGIAPLFFQTEMKKLSAYGVRFEVEKLNKYGVTGYEVKSIVEDDNSLSFDEIEKIISKSSFCSAIKNHTLSVVKLVKKKLTKKKKN